MGEEFRAWADDYYTASAGLEIPKYAAEEAAKHYAKDKNYLFLAKITPNTFKSKTLAWAKYNGYEFKDRINKNIEVPMQDERGVFVTDANGNRIMKRQTKEHILLTKIAEVQPKEQHPLFDAPETDDLI